MSSDARRAAWLRTGPPLIVAALTALAFWSCLRLGLVYDDVVFLNPEGLTAGRALTGAPFCNYAPLSQLTFVGDFEFWRGAPFGYHLTSLLFHAANAAAFYGLCLELFAAGKAAGRDRAAAAVSALLFSLHPLRVQSVAWVSERRDVVCGLFFIGALYFWLRAHRPEERRGGYWRGLSWGAFLLALLSKASAVPLPAILVLLAVFPLGLLPASPRRWTDPAARAVWRETAPFFLLSAAFSPVVIFAQWKCGAIDVIHAPPGERARQILTGLVFYIGKTIWPTRLSFYEWHWAPVRSAVLLGAIATAALLAAAAVSRRLRSPLLAALAYQTLMLAPTLSVGLGHEMAADRYTYLSGLAWAALAGAGLRSLPPRFRRGAAAAAAALALLLAVMARAQSEVWRNSTTLWRRALQLDPMSAIARRNLAAAVMADGRLGEAILLLEEQNRLYPDDTETRAALSGLISSTGTTVRDHARFHEELGREFAAAGKFEGAAWHFKQALRYDPQSAALRAELSGAQGAAGAAR